MRIQSSLIVAFGAAAATVGLLVSPVTSPVSSNRNPPAMLALVSNAAAEAASPRALQDRPGRLTAFRSEAELRAFLERHRPRREQFAYVEGAIPIVAAPADVAEILVSGQVASPSITNNQEAGVDEGGIVKNRGDLLVILRRGRLFTVSTAGGDLRAVDHLQAFPPGVDASDDWYDEMLVSGDRVIVVGYSYGRGGTEINRFRLSADGRLRYEDSHHLTANDYYSSRNYASRLIGTQLILYSPRYLWSGRDNLAVLPGLRRWQGRADRRAFRTIATPDRVFIAPAHRRARAAEIDTLHSVIRCDLAAPALDCTATGVLGGSSRTFYVSRSAVYVWTSPGDEDNAPAFVLRLPFDGGEPGALAARGQPIDQFSFREDNKTGLLNVVVQSESAGDAIFGPESRYDSLALIRVPLSSFGDARRELPSSRYRILPQIADETGVVKNRFVGDWLLYGAVGIWGEPQRAIRPAFAVPLDGGAAVRLPVSSRVDRIEALGQDALLVGGDGQGVVFSTVELGRTAQLSHRFRRDGASEAESRSHGFFYRPDSAGGASGLLGLPILREDWATDSPIIRTSAAMLFLRRSDRRLQSHGELAAAPLDDDDDGCVASCLDWYGNARPIFLGRRIFALLGYELVEGQPSASGIAEIARLNYAPPERRSPRLK